VFVPSEEIKTGAKEFYSSEGDIFAERVGFMMANLHISVIYTHYQHLDFFVFRSCVYWMCPKEISLLLDIFHMRFWAVRSDFWAFLLVLFGAG